MPWDPQIWTEPLQRIVSDALAWLPQLVVALLLLFLGWIVARLTEAIASGLLHRLGIDRLAERAGGAQMLERMGLRRSASEALSRLVYWLVLLIFLAAAVETLGLTGVVDTLTGLVNYLPNVFAAALILLFGSLLARLAGEAAGAMGEQAGIQAGQVLGQLVRYVLLAFVVILGVDQLGVETTLLTTATVALIAATALALALAFGFGSRELARNIMAGFHAQDEFTVGQTLEVGTHRGRLMRIGRVKSILETDEGRISLPNHMLTEAEVLVRPESDPEVE